MSIENQEYKMLERIYYEWRGILCDSRDNTHKILAAIEANTRAVEAGTAAIQANGLILQQIADGLKPEPTTESVAVIFTGDRTMANNALVFNVGQTSTASVASLLADGVTASGGVPSGVTFTFSDPSATVELNSDGVTATCTAVAASTGAVSGSMACTITDTDGVVSPWNVPFTITTDAAVVPPQQLTQSVAVEFSTPTP